MGNIGLETRPVVIIHSGDAPPADAFTSVQYRRTWFWIAEDDFDSKLAFTVLQILLLLHARKTPGCYSDHSSWLNQRFSQARSQPEGE